MYYLKAKCITNVLEMYYKSECLQGLCISVIEKPNYWGGYCFVIYQCIFPLIVKITSANYLKKQPYKFTW